MRERLYRWRFTNWLISKPWTWHYGLIYRDLRKEHRVRGYLYPAHGRLRSAWLALAFPHAHDPKEDDLHE